MIPKEILKKIRRLEFSTRHLVNEVFGGEYHSVFKGRGMEFAEVREYLPGDDIRSIDWNVTARTGKPHVKLFDEERELTVMLLVDASASGAFGSRDRMKREVAAELSAVLAFSAINNNDKVGAIIFTDTVEKYLPPRKGRHHVLHVIRELLYHEPRSKGTNIGAAVEFMSSVMRHRAVVFLISDFLSTGFETPIRIAARRHDFITIRLFDPLEQTLPNAGLIQIHDAETGDIALIDTSNERFRKSYFERNHQRVSSLENYFRSNKLDYLALNTTVSYVEPLEKFFKARAKRVR
ncbi:MAG TPA: DUF58 domain-containing protein [Candidatus Marinimicrobia bacterium]|nr:MAG: hypothetical protein AUJ47_08325 [Candidatus Marinimicrobia bacterium CG1_02_48_14]PIZ68409.1 MAG: DUF58 domain-containing protein [Candidatus Marinimicrobia bacterium CG_4_10_14_0_2_um_filter_48_9]HCW75269.1 DUF58 domain-containing protein [Candidatus Neomarinimicrobiota bacterium]